MTINGTGPGILAEEARRLNGALKLIGDYLTGPIPFLHIPINEPCYALFKIDFRHPIQPFLS
jgi:hypothetical protein